MFWKRYYFCNRILYSDVLYARMVGSASIALLDQETDGSGLPGLRYAAVFLVVAARGMESFFGDVAGIAAFTAFFIAGFFEDQRMEKNSAGLVKNYRICLFGNNFNFIFA